MLWHWSQLVPNMSTDNTSPHHLTIAMNKPSNKIKLASLGPTPNVWKFGQCRHCATQMHWDSTSECHYALFHIGRDNSCSSSAFCTSKMLKLDATWKKCHCIPSAVLLEQNFAKHLLICPPYPVALTMVAGWWQKMVHTNPNPVICQGFWLPCFALLTHWQYTQNTHIPHWNKKNPKTEIPNNNLPHS